MSIFDDIFVHEVYEKRYRMHSGNGVLDIGAHQGWFTKKAAEMVGDAGWVWAFEPEPKNYEALLERVRSYDNVRATRAAVWRYGGERFTLYRDSRNDGAHSIVYKPDEGGDSVTVDGLAIDALPIKRRVNFIKIDAEGAEYEIIRGASNLIATNRPHIAMEIHGQEVWKKIKQWFEGMHYLLEPDTDVNGWVAYATPLPRP